MNKYFCARIRAGLTVTTVMASFTFASHADHPAVTNGPADASVPVPETTYTTVLPGTSEAYLRETEAPRLPWRKLFSPDGRFLSEEALRGEAPATAAASASPQPTTSADVPSGSDARAVIRSINREVGKVKLKHGPIEKLGMPGMTMVFRVKDPALLDQVKEGEEVGVTIEMEGSKFFVTGFQK